jgi:hypothetical protein
MPKWNDWYTQGNSDDSPHGRENMSMNMRDFLLEKFGRDIDGAAENLDAFIKGTEQIESAGGKMLKNPDSTARGNFQFLTKKHKSGKGNSWKVGITRLENTMKSAFGDSGGYDFDSMRERNNPLEEDYHTQEDVFLADLYQKGGKGVTNKLFKSIMEGDREAFLKMYGDHHHTDMDTRTEALAREVFQTPGFPPEEGEEPYSGPGMYKYRGGGLIRDAYGRTLI